MRHNVLSDWPVLHPLIPVHYLKEAQWEMDWIENAIDIAVNCWTQHYKADSRAASEHEAVPKSQFGYSVSL